MRDIREVEDQLDKLQEAYLDAEDDTELMKIESKFMQLLVEATEIDGKDRISANITITNWTREE